jgi:hypothetical protein
MYIVAQRKYVAATPIIHPTSRPLKLMLSTDYRVKKYYKPIIMLLADVR